MALPESLRLSFLHGRINQADNQAENEEVFREFAFYSAVPCSVLKFEMRDLSS